MLMRAGIFTADVFVQSENRLLVLQHVTEPLPDPNKSAIKGSCDLNNCRYNREQRRTTSRKFMKMPLHKARARRGFNTELSEGGFLHTFSRPFETTVIVSSLSPVCP